ncbi:MAG: M1 family peptidase [Sphingomonadales bacterium]|nr:MAG: M1 family peptidase [Sphingomonadales bacterium]
MTTTFLALAPLPALAQGVQPGEPPISTLTRISGGPVSPERAALHLAHVDLAIEVFPDTQQISGTATLTLTTSRPQTALHIDLDKNLTVSAVSVDGRPLRPGAWSNPDGRLRIQLPRPIQAGARTIVRIGYGGTPHVAVRAPWDDGMVWAKTPEGQPWIATTAQGYGCDLFWPCLDFPRGEPDRADLHITAPKGLKAPANGVLQKVDTLADGRTTWHWKARSPNPYSIALDIAPYGEISGTYVSRFGNKIPMHFWHLPGNAAKAKKLFAEFAPVVDFFETNLGPYPWHDEKIGAVETPHLGMEHQTINAYGNKYEQTPKGFDWLFQHEFAHEWFGNQMSAANWDDYWLHEGFGEYMQPLYGRWREGEARYAVMMEELRNSITNKAPLVSGKVKVGDEVYEEDQGGPAGDIYYKGAWVLHTLRNQIGDKAFWDATRRLVYGRPDPQPGNFQPRFASSPEFVKAVNDVTGKDYGWFFDVYLYEAALPELVVTRTGDRLNLRWKAPRNKPFPLPVEVQIDGVVQTVAMPGNTGSIVAAAGAHIVVDPASRILKRSEAVEAYQAYKAAGGR